MSRVLPILFNTEMVKAILDGRKTVTRRLLKQPFEVHPNGYITKPRGNERLCLYEPPYQPGDILYVRETWCDDRQFTHDDTPGQYFYRADCILANVKWHPSIHMPKEAARIWLKVNEVRVERLQEITEEQAEKEGCNDYTSTALGFCYLWDSTIKKSDLDLYGWNANPWVWVIEFERCDKPEGWCE